MNYVKQVRIRVCGEITFFFQRERKQKKVSHMHNPHRFNRQNLAAFLRGITAIFKRGKDSRIEVNRCLKIRNLF
jgi:hypothetical protein